MCFVLYLESLELILFIGNFLEFFGALNLAQRPGFFSICIFLKRKDPNDIFLIQA